MKVRKTDFIVGLFLIAAFLAMVFLAFQVTDFTELRSNNYYTVTAQFDNIGGLKARAPVAMSGVKIGDVTDISLDKNNFRALVTMRIAGKYNTIPVDSSASIFTQGILGSNYVSLAPGFDQESLKNGDRIETTHPAIVLENLIGQLIYSMGSDKTETDAKPISEKNKQEF